MRYINLIIIFFLVQNIFSQTPTNPASNIQYNFVGCNEFTASWNNGNGDFRIVFVKEGTAFTDVPENGEFYTDNAVFGKGEDIKSDQKHYCVYNGSGSSIRVTGLKNLTRYYIAVFEYNSSGGSYDYLTAQYATNDTITKNISAQFTLKPTSQCLNKNTTVFTNKSTSDISPMSFIWKFGDGDSSNTKNTTHQYTTPGIKKIELIALAQGCNSSVFARDTIYPHPNVNFSLDLSLLPKNKSIQCWFQNQFTFSNKTTLLDIGDGPSSMRYDWYNGNILFSTGYKSSISFKNSGTKTIKLVATSHRGCKDSISQTFQVLERVIDTAHISISPKVSVLLNNKFTFETSTNTKYDKWYIIGKTDINFKDTLVGKIISYSFKNSGWYYVVFETKDSGTDCLDRQLDSIEIKSNAGQRTFKINPILIHPNPSNTGVFTLQNLRLSDRVIVSDQIGNIILDQFMDKANFEISLVNLTAGTYFLNIKTNHQIFNYKLIYLPFK